MRPEAHTSIRMRRAAVIAVAVVALHQLRYLLSYGKDSGSALAEHGHGYLSGVLPELLGVALVLVLSSLVAGALRPRGSQVPSGMATDALRCATAVLIIYSVQELAEGAAAIGHPTGLAALTAAGGWIALPIGLALGAVVALVLRWLTRVDIALGTKLRTPALRRSRSCLVAPPVQFVADSRLTLAFGFSRRPPPALLSSI